MPCRFSVTRGDLVAAMPTDERHFPIVKASKAWRKVAAGITLASFSACLTALWFQILWRLSKLVQVACAGLLIGMWQPCEPCALRPCVIAVPVSKSAM